LAGPLAVVEPLKLATVFIAGEGHWSMSGLVMLFAYAVSLFVTHWLFVVVKPKFLTSLRVHGRGLSRFAPECGAPSRAAPARWLDGASFCAKSGQIFFGRHVFDTVLRKILQHWGLGAFP
jgi:hypothetical protein